MKKINTKTTSLFAVTLAALLVTGCLEEKPKDDDNNDNGDPNTEEPDFYEEKGWQLVFADEFEGTVIDDSKWAFEVNCWGGGNAEQQCYVDDPDNAFVEDGKLHIKAIRENYTGAVHNPDSAEYDPAVTQTQPFTSARLRSVAPNDYMEGVDPSFAFKNDWKYGRFEIRAKLPSGQGTWPAIWMLPTDWEFGGWAASGEIDIMEAVNLKADRDLSAEDNGETGIIPENRVHGTLHYGRNWPNNVYSGVGYDFGDVTVNPADDFHTYAVEWEEGAIRWFVDDIHVSTQTQEGWYTHYQDENGDWQTSGTTAAPFDKNFHLIMNLAIGGNWAANVNETGVDDAIQSAEMVVDFVRVYQCADDATGVACASKGEEGTYTLESGTVEPDLPVNVETGGLMMDILSTSLADGYTALVTWDGGDGGDTVAVTEGVVDVTFTGLGNVSLQPSSVVDMTDFSNGFMKFDLKVVSMGTATDIAVKMDSGWPNVSAINVSTLDGGLPTAGGDFVSYVIPVQDFIDGNGSFDISSIVNAVVFEAVGGGDLQISFANVSFTRPLVIASDSLSEAFSALVTWDGGDGGDSVTVTDGVVSVTFGGLGNVSLQPSSVIDLSEFSSGTLQFDLKVVSMGTATDIAVKMDSGWPNVSAINVSTLTGGLPVEGGDAVTFSVAVQDFIDGNTNFDISSIVNAVVFEAVGGGDLQIEFSNVSFIH